jgi:ABC-type sugar transport system permease subunit
VDKLPTGNRSASKRRSTESGLVWYVFLLPTILGMLLFMAYPVLDSLRLSFFKSNGMIESWVGLRNYVRIFGSTKFWRAVYTTFYIGFFKMLISIPVGFMLAYLINTIGFGKTLFKILYFIPYVTSLVAAGGIFLFVLHPGDGLLNSLIGLVGIPNVEWLSHPTSARWGAIILSVWHWLGFVIIICIANLQTIPPELYEASTIDGATERQQLFYITIPRMASAFAFLFVMGWISALKIFAEPYVLGRGNWSPAEALLTLTGFVYERGFGGTEYGFASAASYVLFLIIFLITLVNTKLVRMR